MLDALSESPFSNIPNEILFQIFKLLSISDLGKVSLVCRFFKTIASQDEIWQSKCCSEFCFTLLFHWQSPSKRSITQINFKIVQTNLHGLDLWEISSWSKRKECSVFQVTAVHVLHTVSTLAFTSLSYSTYSWISGFVGGWI